MYNGSHSKIKKDPWQDWEDEIKNCLDRRNFLSVWKEHIPYFDLDFTSHFNQWVPKQ